MRQDIIDPEKTEFLKSFYLNIVFVNFVLFVVKNIFIEEFS